MRYLKPKRRMIQFSLSALLLLMLVSAVIASRFQPVELNATIVPIKSDDENGTIKFLIKNESRNSLWYYGHGSENPFYSAQDKIGNQWIERGIGYCGTGATYHEIKRGDVAEFSVWHTPKESTSVKAGIHIYARPNSEEMRLIWSEPATLPSN